MEENVFSPTTETDIEHIYMLKREVVEMRRAVGPLTLALQRIGTDHNDLISKEVRRYMRDVLDHNTQASDRIASYDEVLSSLVQAAVGKVSMQQNIDMRKISAWVAIAAVPTALAGIYGMNFDHMPELHQVWGYPAVLVLMATVCTAALRHLPTQPLARRSGRQPPRVKAMTTTPHRFPDRGRHFLHFKMCSVLQSGEAAPTWQLPGPAH